MFEIQSIILLLNSCKMWYIIGVPYVVKIYKKNSINELTSNIIVIVEFLFFYFTIS